MAYSVGLLRDFLHVPDNAGGAAVNAALAQLGALVGADRACLVRYDARNDPEVAVEWVKGRGADERLRLQSGAGHTR